MYATVVLQPRLEVHADGKRAAYIYIYIYIYT